MNFRNFKSQKNLTENIKKRHIIKEDLKRKLYE